MEVYEAMKVIKAECKELVLNALHDGLTHKLRYGEILHFGVKAEEGGVLIGQSEGNSHAINLLV